MVIFLGGTISLMSCCLDPVAMPYLRAHGATDDLRDKITDGQPAPVRRHRCVHVEIPWT
jgi:hypothetical protein